jgi:predicted Zn-dependent protease
VLSHFWTLLAWNDRFDAALELDRGMIERDPVSPMARINYANTLIAAGRLDEAREEFLMAAELNRD